MSPARRDTLAYRKGVGAVLFNTAGRIFVGRRVDQAQDAWQLPQGGIDAGESPEHALWRELREEIGTDRAEIIARTADWVRYDLPESLIGKAWRGRYRGQEQIWFALRFTGQDADIDITAADHPEFDAWRWAAIEELPALAVAFKRPVYERLVAEFGRLAAAD